MRLTKLLTICGPVLALAASAPAALGDTGVSSNWSGYAVHRGGVSFQQVASTWKLPRLKCRRGQRRYSAMWVGLGGFARNSRALEQIGTEIDCTRGGRIAAMAWYELVPAPSRSVHLKVRAGDWISASVSVVGHTVVLTLSNLTSHTSTRKASYAAFVDVSSAEWILEAPSDCVGSGSCKTLPLANFGSATFGSARALTSTGHTGTISDPMWGRTRILLRPGGRGYMAKPTRGSAGGAANPSNLSRDGGSFRVMFLRVATRARR